MDTEITVALIGAAGVCGTIVGTVVGARIQAHGGHAQAQAARDAAATAAQAARHQALHELRWTVLSTLLRAAEECMEATEPLYTSSQARADAARAELERVYHVFRLALAEAEIAAPPGMAGELNSLQHYVMWAYGCALWRAPTERALRALDELIREGDPAAVRAKEALARLRALGPAGLTLHLESGASEYAEEIEALYAVPGLDREQGWLLLQSTAAPLERTRLENVRALQEREERKSAYLQARRALIAAARDALSTNEP